ncbi:hypothetical protein Acr_11g0007330 [Actinidia rufa]|uniref:Mitochondrial transcription termination factor family protein n=1 Tax=Actinidia rufa TaxID=165716 RepID=A0A7J0FEU9_9ERIC|nr:hypothetical protein Acr_11g0007330 [Actinidia rufa]
MYSCRSLIALSLKNPHPFSLYKPHISSFSLLFSSSSRQDRITLADYLLRRHQFSPETVSKLSSPEKYLKNPENSDSVLSFLEESGFSRTQIEQVIKRDPVVLAAKLDTTIKPKIKVLQDSGLSPNDIAEIISTGPWILRGSTDYRLGQTFLTLKSVLGSVVGVSKVLKRHGLLLVRDLEKTLIPNVEFLKSCGISSSQMVKYVYNFPRFFLNKPETIKECVRRVDKMGFSRESKTFLFAIRAISSMTVGSWELKLELFRSLGFSDDDIASAFRRAPHVFAISERKIKEVTRTLVHKGRSDISFIIRHPGLLGYSVENRLEPRLQVLEVLEMKKLLPRKPSLTTVLTFTDERFFEKYVLPYLNEVGNVYASLMRANRQQKPVL